MKSAHRDVALWRFEAPVRSLWGLHMRARTAEARASLADKLVAMQPGDSHHLHLGSDPQTADIALAPKTLTAFTDVTLMRSDTLPQADTGLTIGLDDESWAGLIHMLETVTPEGESSVGVATPSGHEPLWLWWDA